MNVRTMSANLTPLASTGISSGRDSANVEAAPLPWGIAVPLIAALSALMWVGLYLAVARVWG